MPIHRPVSTAALVGGALLVLAGCGAPAAPGATAGAGAPLTIDNCGVEVSFDAPPERVVTIKSTSTELLLALGLGDRIVGIAFQDGPVPERWAADAADLPVIAERVPSEEAVLELEPDLVYAGWESNFSADGAGERDELAALGVATYVQPAACQSTGQPAKLDFEEIFREIEEVAAIFEVDAADLVAEQRATLASIEPVDGAPTALWWSSGTDTPFVGAGIGAPQLILETAGLSNIAGDLDATWGPFGWEAVLDADPDVLVLVDAAWNTAEHKIAYLESNPATANLTAVRAGRYVVVPFPAGEAGVRTVDAAASVADQVRKLDLP